MSIVVEINEVQLGYQRMLMELVNETRLSEERDREPYPNVVCFVLANDIFGFNTWDLELDYQLLAQSVKALRYLNRDYNDEGELVFDLDAPSERSMLANTINFSWFAEANTVIWSEDGELPVLNPDYSGPLTQGLYFGDEETNPFIAARSEDLNAFANAVCWYYDTYVKGQVLFGFPKP